MTVTRLDVVNQAYRRLGVLAQGDTLPAELFESADATLGALHDELSEIAPMVFDLDNIPDRYLIPLGNLLAVEMGPSFNVATEPRGRPLSRVMAMVRPDDRIPDDPVQTEYF